MAARTPLPTRFTVCADAAHVGPLAGELVAAGWTRIGGIDVDPEPWSRKDEGVLCAADRLDEEALPTVLELLTRGVSVVAHFADRRPAARVFDEGRRLASAEWIDASQLPATARLSAIQFALLAAIGDGADVRGAASTVHTSPRSAARLLAAARAVLGVDTTAEAVVRVTARATALRTG